MNKQRKRYCLHCEERIRHNARRCYRCGKMTLLWSDYALLTLAVTVFVFMLWKFFL